MSEQTQLEAKDSGDDYYLCPDDLPSFQVKATNGKTFFVSRTGKRWYVKVYRKGRDSLGDFREGYYEGFATALQWAISDAMGHVAPTAEDRQIAMYVLTLKAQ